MGSALNGLRESVARYTEQGELHNTTAIAGLSLFRRDEPTEPISGMSEPETAAPAGSKTAEARGAPRCGNGGIPGRLRESFAVQPGIPSAVWGAAVAGHRETAAGGRGLSGNQSINTATTPPFG